MARKRKRRKKKAAAAPAPADNGLSRFQKLSCVRLRDFRALPSPLLEQIKGRSWSPELLVTKYSRAAQHNLCHLWGFVDEFGDLQGFLWANIDPLSQALDIIAFSVDRRFQDGKTVIPTALELAKALRDAEGLLKIRFATSRPGAMMKYGIFPSRTVMMEV